MRRWTRMSLIWPTNYTHRHTNTHTELIHSEDCGCSRWSGLGGGQLVWSLGMHCRETYSRIYVCLRGSLYACVREISVMRVCKERTGWQVFNPPLQKTHAPSGKWPSATSTQEGLEVTQQGSFWTCSPLRPQSISHLLLMFS